ncbi:hypothetical protein CJ030_MR4G029200 [Morella rubra]|uniref:Uncharacterized protein n=1 Tax=Morella rubra TaxID=262757 RepID=A0A6A1VTX3_9ROSI|nr:hypothetical protein CJ030_MR4G029200 [Morella rubra]
MYRVLKEQNLPGTLPLDLVRFPYLEEIDLTRNYLNGTIPPQWGSVKLGSYRSSLLGNRLTGSIPKELANITTLKSIFQSISNKELGFVNPSVVEYNQLSGNLPPELGNLSSLERILLGSNYFTGELPTSFAKLTTLTDLRISDLNGSAAAFPPLNNVTGLKTLFLPVPEAFWSFNVIEPSLLFGRPS